MLQHSNSANELLLRRKLEEQQQAAELQQAIELQNRRLMGLQLLDLKARTAAAATSSPLPTPIANSFASSQPVSTNAVESPPESGMHSSEHIGHLTINQFVSNVTDHCDSLGVDRGAAQVEQWLCPRWQGQRW